MAMSKIEREKMTTAALMDQVQEEAAELIQAVAKLRKFGPRPLAAGIQYDNVADTITEFKQLRGFMDVLLKRISPRRVARRPLQKRTAPKRPYAHNRKASPVRKAS